MSVGVFRPTDEPNGLQRLAEVYAAYNAHRPLAHRRDAAYWRTYLPPRFAAPTAFALAARRQPDSTAIDGYLLAHLFDGHFIANEIALRPGAPNVAAALLGALAREAKARGSAVGRIYLPFEPEVDSALSSAFATLTVGYHHAMMAKPVGPACGQIDVDAVFAAPGAISWPSDDF